MLLLLITRAELKHVLNMFNSHLKLINYMSLLIIQIAMWENEIWQIFVVKSAYRENWKYTNDTLLYWNKCRTARCVI